MNDPTQHHFDQFFGTLETLNNVHETISTGPIPGAEDSDERREHNEQVTHAAKEATNFFQTHVKRFAGDPNQPPLPLDEAHKLIAYWHLTQENRLGASAKRETIESHIGQFDRVRQWLDRSGDIIFDGNNLFRAQGAEGITVQPALPYDHNREHGIYIQVGVGTSVYVSGEPDTPEFPDISIDRNNILQTSMFQRRNIDRAGAALNRWDPEQRAEGKTAEESQPFRYLGNRNAPEITQLDIEDDAERFALRFAAEDMGEHDWLDVPQPRLEFRKTIEKEIGLACVAALLRVTPSDAVEKHRVVHSHPDSYATLATDVQRRHSFSSFTLKDIGIMMRATGASPELIRTAVAQVTIAEPRGNTIRSSNPQPPVSEAEFNEFFAHFDQETKPASS